VRAGRTDAGGAGVQHGQADGSGGGHLGGGVDDDRVAADPDRRRGRRAHEESGDRSEGGVEVGGSVHRGGGVDGDGSCDERPGTPPRVSYALTPRGESLRPVLAALWRWGVRDEASWVG
jgi:hypothetical protein